MVVPKLERSLGIEVYATRSGGIGGTLKEDVEDFIVEEVLVDGAKAQVTEPEGNEKRTVLGSSALRNHYLLCILVKRNWDTLMALRNVAKELDISPEQIQIAGIKDAKAVTAQHVTVEDVTVEDVWKVRLKDIEVRPIGYLRTELSAYYLLGNSFRIVVRGVKHGETAVRRRIGKTVEELERLGGVPNFFGHQRFGTRRPITHLVGEALAKGSLGGAALLFLTKSSDHEHPLSRQARVDLRATQDFKRALKAFPKQLRYERLMLKSLARCPDDFAGAFRRLPAKLLGLFIQAYQSYLFNRFLSGRIENGFALNVAEVGDYAVSVERSGVPMSRMHRVVSSESLSEVNNALRNGRMRLAVPLIGFKQHTSQGVQGEIENRILGEEKVSSSDFKVSAMPEISSRGQLRVITSPLLGFSLNDVSGTGGRRNLTVKVGFTLYRGSYATVALREVMKPRDPVKAGF